MSPPADSPADGPATGGGDDDGLRRRRRAATASATASASTSTATSATAAGGGSASCSGAVILYEHTNFQGRCWGFPAGQTDYVGDAANDQASSIWVADGYVATIYLHA